MLLNTLQVRNELEWEILAKRYLHDVLKRECWASMMIKDRSVEVRSRTSADMSDNRNIIH